MRKLYLAATSAFATFLGIASTHASWAYNWVTLVTPTQASAWSAEVVSSVTVLVSAIVALGWFFITKYFGNRILAFLERVLNR